MHRTRNTGFTLVELMVTIAIVAILAAIAFPSFEGSLRSNRVATKTNELIAALSLARSEGVRNPRGAVVCPSTNGTTCGGAWTDGLIVWVDVDGLGGDQPAAPDRVIRYSTGSPRLALTATATAPAPASANLLRFDARGRVVNGGQHVFTLLPDTCPANQDLKRILTVTATGQVQTAKVSCS